VSKQIRRFDMTYLTAVTTGLGFFTGVMLGWVLVAIALFTAYLLVKFFSKPEAPDVTVEERNPFDDFLNHWDHTQSEPAYVRRSEGEQLEFNFTDDDRS
tara:strand:+ start:181 stop:477 length:297 start_codon:yes stop_codon:yes gene_type:complete